MSERVCSGCLKLTTNSLLCDDCTEAKPKRKSFHARGYRAEYQRNRKKLLKDALCVDCGNTATVSDHAPLSRQELLDRGIKNPDQAKYMEPRCSPCHSRRHMTELRDQGRI